MINLPHLSELKKTWAVALIADNKDEVLFNEMQHVSICKVNEGQVWNYKKKQFGVRTHMETDPIHILFLKEFYIEKYVEMQLLQMCRFPKCNI